MEKQRICWCTDELDSTPNNREVREFLYNENPQLHAFIKEVKNSTHSNLVRTIDGYKKTYMFCSNLFEYDKEYYKCWLTQTKDHFIYSINHLNDTVLVEFVTKTPLTSYQEVIAKIKLELHTRIKENK